jgi:hypothetical protein
LIFGKRVRFAILVLSSQLLLLAMAITWLIQMLVIAVNGSVKFVEYSRPVLIMEIVLSALIALFAILVFILQLRKLAEKRSDDRNNPGQTKGPEARS